METNTLLENVNFSLLEDLGNQAKEVLPIVLSFILFIIGAWVFLRIVLFVVKKGLRISKMDALIDKINEKEIFGSTKINVSSEKVVVPFVKWLTILFIVVIGSDFLGLKTVSEGIGTLIGYLPKLLSALFIFGIGIYIAGILRNTVKGLFKSFELNGSKLVGNIVFYLIAVIVSVTALDQAGVNTQMITSNLTLIFGSLLLAFTVAFGLGSRKVIEKLLFGFYSRKNFEIGKTIKGANFEGVVLSIDNICLVVATDSGKLVIPIDEIVSQKVKILD